MVEQLTFNQWVMAVRTRHRPLFNSGGRVIGFEPATPWLGGQVRHLWIWLSGTEIGTLATHSIIGGDIDDLAVTATVRLWAWTFENRRKQPFKNSDPNGSRTRVFTFSSVSALGAEGRRFKSSSLYRFCNPLDSLSATHLEHQPFLSMARLMIFPYRCLAMSVFWCKKCALRGNREALRER